LTANICQNYLTLYIILKLLPSSFICRIYSNTKSLNYPKSTILTQKNYFSLYQEFAEPYFPLEFITFSQLHPVLINFRISSHSKKQSVDAIIDSKFLYIP
jgi:hypothetical protein